MTLREQRSVKLVGNDEVFRTERLVIRKWRETDEPDLLALYSMDRVVQWIDDGQALTSSEATQWMAVTRNNYQKFGYGMFAIEDLNSSRVIGYGGLVHPGGQADAEIKYAFQPDTWGLGIATEFVQGLVGYARDEHGLSHVIATVDVENLASKRVLAKSGFRQTGTRTEEDGSTTVIFEAQL